MMIKLEDWEVKLFKEDISSLFIFHKWFEHVNMTEHVNQMIAERGFNIVESVRKKTVSELFGIFDDRYMFYLDNRDDGISTK